MSDVVETLAQRLVAVAAKALDEAGFVDPDDGCMPTFVDRPYPEGRIDTWKRPEVAGGAVVVAVLRELADSYPNESETNATPEEAVELYALADMIEKASQGKAANWYPMHDHDGMRHSHHRENGGHGFHEGVPLMTRDEAEKAPGRTGGEESDK